MSIARLLGLVAIVILATGFILAGAYLSTGVKAVSTPDTPIRVSVDDGAPPLITSEELDRAEQALLKDIKDHAADLERLRQEVEARPESERNRIRNDAGAVTKSDGNRQIRAMRQTEVDGYLQLTQDPASVQKLAVEFLEAFFDGSQRIHGKQPDWDAIRVQSQAAIDAGSQDPLVKYYRYLMMKHALPVDEKKRTLEAVITEMDARNYPRLTRYFAKGDLAEALLTDGPNTLNSARLRSTLHAIADYAEEQVDNADVHRRVLADFQHYRTKLAKSDDDHDQAYRIAMVRGFHPWIKHMVAGRRHVKVAWQHRGTTFASDVPEEAWEPFREHMAKAAAHYKRAWSLQPNFPEAPTEMIKIAANPDYSNVTMHLDPNLWEMFFSEGKFQFRPSIKPTDRWIAWGEWDWFYRATDAQMDYKSAYDELSNFILPKWGGSIESRERLARECVETGRFDTDAPWYMIDAYHNWASDGEGTDEFRNFPDMEATIDKLLAGSRTVPEDQRPEWHSDWDLSYLATLYGAAGAYTKARDLIDELGPRYRPDTFSDLKLFQPLEHPKTIALGGPFGEEILNHPSFDLKQLTTGDDPEARQKILQAIEKARPLDEHPQAQWFFDFAEKLMRQKDQFDAGDWVSLDFNHNNNGWGIWADESSVDESGTMTMSNLNGGRYLSAIPHARFHDNYAIEADFEIVPGEKAVKMVTIHLGPRVEKWDPTGARFVCYETGGGQVFARTNGPVIPVPKQPVNRLRVLAWKGHYQFLCNGTTVIDAPDNTFEPEPRITLGEPVFARNYPGVIRISNVRICRLPPRPEESSESQRSFLDAMLKLFPDDAELTAKRTALETN